MHAVLAGGGGDPGHLGAGNFEGLFIEAQVGASHQDRRLHEGKIGVIGKEGFWEDDQLDPGLGGLLDRIKKTHKRPFQVPQHGPDLGRSDGNRGGHRSSHGSPMV